MKSKLYALALVFAVAASLFADCSFVRNQALVAMFPSDGSEIIRVRSWCVDTGEEISCDRHVECFGMQPCAAAQYDTDYPGFLPCGCGNVTVCENIGIPHDPPVVEDVTPVN